jgi:hypothetical protein
MVWIIIPTHYHCTTTFLWPHLHLLQRQEYLFVRFVSVRSRLYHMCRSSQFCYAYLWPCCGRCWREWTFLWFYDHHRLYCPIKKASNLHCLNLEYVWNIFCCWASFGRCFHRQGYVEVVLLGKLSTTVPFARENLLTCFR